MKNKIKEILENVVQPQFHPVTGSFIKNNTDKASEELERLMDEALLKFEQWRIDNFWHESQHERYMYYNSPHSVIYKISYLS